MTDTTTQSVTALLPCPFCGCETVEDWGEATWSRPAKWMYCTECQAHGPRCIAERGEGCEAFILRIKAEWNSRIDVANTLLAERDAIAAQLAAAELRAREASLDALAAYGQAADAHAAQLAAEAERDSWRAQHDYLQIESAKCFDAQSEIDEAWDAIGTAGNKQILTLPEQISALCRDYDARAEAAEQRLATARAEALEEAARVCDAAKDKRNAQLKQYPDDQTQVMRWMAGAVQATCLAAAIRALAKGGRGMTQTPEEVAALVAELRADAELHEDLLPDRAADAITAQAAEIADLKMSVIAFCAPWAATYADQHGLPKGHLHPTHYDILAKAGARMDDFTRAAMEGYA